LGYIVSEQKIITNNEIIKSTDKIFIQVF